jgi:PKD repeat protein
MTMEIAKILLLALLVSMISLVAFGASAYALSASFTMNQSTGTAAYQQPFVVQFTDTSTGGTPLSYLWDFGDGTNSTLKNPVHAYYDADQYNVTERVTFRQGPYYATGTVNVLLWANGNVTSPLSLSVANLLNNYPQNAIVNQTYGAHGAFYQMNASGASLNAILSSMGVKSGASSVTFYGSDGFNATILLSAIAADNQSMIATRWNSSDNSSSDLSGLRDILPSQTYAQEWVYDLDGFTVS